MRAFLLLAAIGTLIVGTALHSERRQRQRLEALARAVADRRVDEVRTLLAPGVDPNEDLDGSRLLEHAARAGHVDVVALLLMHGAVVPGDSRIARKVASRALAGENDGVRRLLLLASDPGQGASAPFGSLLFLVAADGDADLATALVEAGAPVDEARAVDGMTPLCGAALAGSAPVATLLLDHGVDPSVARTHFGRSPLHFAALGSSPQVVTELLASGADASVADHLGWTPLHLAALCGHADAVRALARDAAAANALDARDIFGWTPLMRAVPSGDAPSVDALIAVGADVGMASTSGRTALHVAAERGDAALYERLLSSGANEDARDSFDITPRELRTGNELPLDDPEADKLGEPIARAAWYSYDIEAEGKNEAFAAWDDGVVLFADIGISYPWTTTDSLRVGRIPSIRARRLSVEIEESALFRHPARWGSLRHHPSMWSFARALEGGGAESIEVPLEREWVGDRWPEIETNATFERVLHDVEAILASARPTSSEPLTDHFVDRRFLGEGSFRGIRWTK